MKKTSGGTSKRGSGYSYTASRPRGKPPEGKEREKAVEKCLRRIQPGRPREAFREFINALLDQNAIPLELLKEVPGKPGIVQKTRFDQLYDACMFLAFPNYRPIVRAKAFGPEPPADLKLWRALFPKDLGVTHVIVRACSFQEAFALACDYACRMTLREKRHIPTDLTVRVQFLGDKAASRMLDIRHAVRDRTRRVGNHEGRAYSPKDILGARMVAIGLKNGKYSIFKYVEERDLRHAEKAGLRRTSAIDIETFLPKEDPPPYDCP